MYCSQSDFLLDFILSKKITDLAKRALRLTFSDSYDFLYRALRQNVAIMSSVELSRTRLEGIKQIPTESITNYNLRNQKLGSGTKTNARQRLHKIYHKESIDQQSPHIQSR